MATPELRRNVYLALDWDETLTQQDTLGALRNICRARDARVGIAPHNQRPWPCGPQIDECWDKVGRAYMDDRTAHKAKHFPREKQLDANGYRAWLRSLSSVEHDGVAHLEKSRLFAGVHHVDVAKGAQQAVRSGHVKLRPGWWDLIRLIPMAPECESNVGIISVNWSANFIRECLLEAVRTQVEDPPKWMLDFVDHDLDIIANEIDGIDSRDGSNGAIVGGLHSSSAKVARLSVATSEFEEYNQKIVYIGDSPTDFECLTRADVGIWIRDMPESSFEEEFAKMFAPFNKRPQALTKLGRDAVGLVWAPNLTSVVHYLSSLE